MGRKVPSVEVQGAALNKEYDMMFQDTDLLNFDANGKKFQTNI